MCGHNHQRDQCAYHASLQGSTAPTETSSVDKEVTSKTQQLNEQLTLARNYLSLGNILMARECYEALLPMADSQLGRDTPFTLDVVASLIKIYYEQNDRQAAMRLIFRKT